MPAEKAGHSSAVLSHQIYLIGGHNGRQEVSSVERFDPITMRWETSNNIHHPYNSGIAPLLMKSNGHTSVAAFSTTLMEPCIIVTGGYDGQGWTTAVQRYNPQVNAWNYLQSMNQKRAYHTAVIL